MEPTPCPHCDCGELHYRDNWGFDSYGEPYQGLEFIVCSNDCLNGGEGFTIYSNQPSIVQQKEENFTCPICEIHPVKFYLKHCGCCGEIDGQIEIFDFSNQVIDLPF